MDKFAIDIFELFYKQTKELRDDVFLVSKETDAEKAKEIYFKSLATNEVLSELTDILDNNGLFSIYLNWLQINHNDFYKIMCEDKQQLDDLKNLNDLEDLDNPDNK